MDLVEWIVYHFVRHAENYGRVHVDSWKCEPREKVNLDMKMMNVESEVL